MRINAFSNQHQDRDFEEKEIELIDLKALLPGTNRFVVSGAFLNFGPETFVEIRVMLLWDITRHSKEVHPGYKAMCFFHTYIYFISFSNKRYTSYVQQNFPER